jgi:hypothetical protein
LWQRSTLASRLACCSSCRPSPRQRAGWLQSDLRAPWVRVIVDCGVGVDALLIVREQVLKHWYNLSDRPKATAFTASFKALCRRLQRLQHIHVLCYHRPVSSFEAVRSHPPTARQAACCRDSQPTCPYLAFSVYSEGRMR